MVPNIVTRLVRNIVTAKNDVVIDSVEERKLGDSAKHFISVPSAITVKGRYLATDAPFEISFFAKKRLLSPLFSKDGLETLFRNEKFVYEKLFPALEEASSEELPRPKFYGASEDYVLLENLAAANYQPANMVVGLDLEETKLVLQKLASYHGSSLKLKETKAEDFASMTEALPASFMAKWVATFAEHLDGTTEPAYEALSVGKLTHIADHIRAHNLFTLDALASFFNAHAEEDALNLFIHGDTKSDNMMFLHADAPSNSEPGVKGKLVDFKFIDFQTVRQTSILVDVFLFLGTSVNTSVFKSELPHLLEFYLEEFLGACSRMGVTTPPPRASFWREVERISGFALLAMAMYLPIHSMDFGKDVDWATADMTVVKQDVLKLDRTLYNAKLCIYADALAKYFMKSS